MITSCWILQAFFVCWPAWPLFLLLFLSKVLMITRSMILWFLFKWWNLLRYGIAEWSVLESKFRAVWQTTGGWGRQGFWALAAQNDASGNVNIVSDSCSTPLLDNSLLLAAGLLKQVKTFEGDNLCPALEASKHQSTKWEAQEPWSNVQNEKSLQDSELC